MKISCEKNFIYLVFLSLIFSTFFWIIHDIDSRISSNGGDITRYYAYYYDTTLDSLLTISWQQGRLFYGILYLLNCVGISFELFLFIVINLYYITFAKLARNFLKTKNIYIVVLIYGALSFWLVPSVLVALRQGFSILLIAMFLEILDRKNSFLLKFLIIFFIANIHFSAIILFPLIVFWNVLKKNILLLNSLFFISLLLYLANSWYFLSSQIILLFTNINLNLGAMSFSNSNYVVGFSIYKMAAFLLPVIIYKIPTYFGYRHHMEVVGIYIIFIYFSIIGMIFSGFPYHDRLFLYAWVFSPILIASFFTVTHKNYVKRDNIVEDQRQQLQN
jgi:hypothetical protein